MEKISEKYLRTICSSNLFIGVTQQEVEGMLLCLKPKRQKYEKNELILRQGDNLRAIGLILAGCALIFQEDRWANRNVVSKLESGQTFGVAFACSPKTELNVNIIAESSLEVMYLDVKQVLNVCSSACAYHNKIIRNLIAELAQKNLKLNEKLTHMSKRSTREKLMSYLSEQSIKSGKAEFDIVFSRQQLADYLSVERSGLSLELSKMQKEGLIEYNKNHFTIKV